MFEVAILVINPELTKEEYRALMYFLSPEKQNRIKKYHFYRDARNCMLGDVLARFQVHYFSGLNMKQIKFSTNAFGKPFLINAPDIHFNISHTGHYIACAIDDEPVGIDIELIKPIEQQIAEKFFTSDELAYVMADDYLHRFYEIWTMKESRVKWEGEGLYISLSSFSVLQNERTQIHYQKVFQNDEVICNICSRKKFPPSIRLIDSATFVASIT